jgi:hypothetical protein
MKGCRRPIRDRRPSFEASRRQSVTSTALGLCGGYVIKPHERVELLIGLKTTGPGIASYESIDVYYTAGHDRYTTAYPDHLRACTPFKRYLHRCRAVLDQRRTR